jgi:hypothetical protein
MKPDADLYKDAPAAAGPYLTNIKTTTEEVDASLAAIARAASGA